MGGKMPGIRELELRLSRKRTRRKYYIASTTESDGIMNKGGHRVSLRLADLFCLVSLSQKRM
jgi:hypothetical protein